MSERRRKSGIRSVPSSKSFQVIERTRENNKRLRNSEVQSYTWDESKIEKKSSSYWGGWTFFAGDLSEQTIGDARKVVFPSTEKEVETDQDREDREFFINDSSAPEYPENFSSYFQKNSDSWQTINSYIPIPFCDTIEKSAPNAELANSVLLENSALADFPVIDVNKDLDIPWNSREFISPYGFYDQNLRNYDYGIQTISEMESFGLVPSTAQEGQPHKIRAKRGQGSDNWDWLPESVTSAHFMKAPYNDFYSFTELAREFQVFDPYNNNEIDSYILNNTLYYDSNNFNWLGTSRKPKKLIGVAPEEKGFVQPVFVARPGLRPEISTSGDNAFSLLYGGWAQFFKNYFSRIDPSLVYEGDESGLASFYANLKNSNLFKKLNNRQTTMHVKGGFMVGGENYTLNFPFWGDDYVSDKFHSSGIIKQLNEKNWAIEIGFSPVFSDISRGGIYKGKQQGDPLNIFYTLNQKILTTRPEGGFEGEGYPSKINKSKNGLEISYMFFSNSFQTLDSDETKSILDWDKEKNGILCVIAKFTRNGEPRIATASYNMVLDQATRRGEINARIFVERFGKRVKVRCGLFGLDEKQKMNEDRVDFVPIGYSEKTIDVELWEDYEIQDSEIVIPSLGSSEVFTTNEALAISLSGNESVDLEEINFGVLSSVNSAKRSSPEALLALFIPLKECLPNALYLDLNSNSIDYTPTYFKHTNYGFMLNGLAFHDSTIENTINPENSRYNCYNLQKSSWLTGGENQSIIRGRPNFSAPSSLIYSMNTIIVIQNPELTPPAGYVGNFVARFLTDRVEIYLIVDNDKEDLAYELFETFMLLDEINISDLETIYSFPYVTPNFLTNNKTLDAFSLSSGVPSAIWNFGHTWNDVFSVSGIQDGRPWGLPVSRVSEYIDKFSGRAGARDLLPVSDSDAPTQFVLLADSISSNDTVTRTLDEILESSIYEVSYLDNTSDYQSVVVNGDGTFSSLDIEGDINFETKKYSIKNLSPIEITKVHLNLKSCALPRYTSWGTRFENYTEQFTKNSCLQTAPFNENTILKEEDHQFLVGTWIRIFDLVNDKNINPYNLDIGDEFGLSPSQIIWSLSGGANTIELRVRVSSGVSRLEFRTNETTVGCDIDPKNFNEPIYVLCGLIKNKITTPNGNDFYNFIIPYSLDDDLNTELGRILSEFDDSLGEDFIKKNTQSTKINRPAGLTSLFVGSKNDLFGSPSPSPFPKSGYLIDYVIGGIEFSSLPLNFNLVVDHSNSPEYLEHALTSLVFLAAKKSFNLWGYTGDARIQPDSLGVSAIDGIAHPTWLNTENEFLNNRIGSENFQKWEFPNSFISNKGLQFSRERRANYEFRNSERLHLFQKLQDIVLEELNGVDGDVSERFGMSQKSALEAISFLSMVFSQRGFDSPVNAVFEILSKKTSTEQTNNASFAGTKMCPLYIPSGDDSSYDYDIIIKKISEALKIPIDKFAETITNFSFLAYELSLEDSKFYEGKSLSDIEFQRIRCEYYPYLEERGRNAIVVTYKPFRGDDGKTIFVNAYDDFDFLLGDSGKFNPKSIYYFDFDITTSENLLPLSYIFSDNTDYSAIESSLLKTICGNLCLLKDSINWSIVDSEDSPKLEILEEDLFAENAIWKQSKGGRRLLKVHKKNKFNKIEIDAFSGRSSKSLNSTSWCVSVGTRTFQDSITPDVYEILGNEKEFSLNINTGLKIDNFISPRKRRAWRRKQLQQPVRDFASSSPTNWSAGLSGFSQFIGTEKVAEIQSSWLGFPCWGDDSDNFYKSSASGLKHDLLSKTESFEAALENEYSNIWANWSLDKFSEINNPSGKISRNKLGRASSFLKYQFLEMPKRKSSNRTLSRSVSGIGQEQSSKYDPEKYLLSGIRSDSSIEGTIHSFDRLAIFGDEFPVVNMQYSRRPVIDYAGGLDENFESSLDNAHRPASISSGVSRYRAEGEGFKRNTTLRERVFKEFKKLIFGFGDSLIRSDYLGTQTNKSDYYLESGNKILRIDELDSNTAEQITEDLKNSNLTSWSLNRFSKYRPITSVLPFLPNAETGTYYNKSFWTRDVKLQGSDSKFGDSLWMFNEFSFPKDVFQNVKILPRGWRFGLMNCEPIKETWAINPRSWGQMTDIQRINPVGASEGFYPVETTYSEPSDIINSEDKFMRKFRPFLDVDTIEEAKAIYTEYESKPPSYPEELTKEQAFNEIENYKER